MWTHTSIMQRASRLKKELRMLAIDPPPGITCWQEKDQVDDLRAQILGGASTPYEKGVFTLEVIIPERYPFEPPQIRFLTPIYHPNIDSSGRICLDLLMAEPNPDDPLMADIVRIPISLVACSLLYLYPLILQQLELVDEEMLDDSSEVGDSEEGNCSQKRKARPLGGIDKKFHPDVQR
ncbi:hypothetical protein A6R68_01000, partial [Neotoma lepida]